MREKAHDRSSAALQQRRTRPPGHGTLRAAGPAPGGGRQPRKDRGDRRGQRGLRVSGGHAAGGRPPLGPPPGRRDLVRADRSPRCSPLRATLRDGVTMITGTVTADLEATLQLEVLGRTGQSQQVRVVIDTGFSGFLTLTPAVIASLGRPRLGLEQGVLADGSTQLFEVFRAEVIWDGQPRMVEVDAADTQPLLGMTLLAGHELKIQAVSGGVVTITALP